MPRTRPPAGGKSAPADSSAERPQAREPLADPVTPREVVDHALSRKAAIDHWHRTGGVDSDAREAHPYLIRAAKWHGEPTDRRCPLCLDTELVELTYVYGRELGAFSGRIHAKREIRELALSHGVLRVFVVEVCQGCHWNHLVTSYVVGDGIPRRPKRRPSEMDW